MDIELKEFSLEDAIEWFKNSPFYNKDHIPFNMAIKALEALRDVKPETVTEFADRCRECGARYGKLLKQEPDMYIPFLIHKEMDIPISECKKAYDIAINYLRSQANVKG